ncbi:putative ABC transport system ATP-binding protein [Curtobacterium sp. PhB142]|uniref:ABC transporter ATP-binding protein n=1 Tax=unclassified Curtobacterium TaxID=257496 RepID=UPI001051C236|nr:MULTISPECIES: ABC transporter ATP-binding protein [unclassified Curtobacterium]TCL81965.1 putative ABC transport system ATP-binding protein [Curtobacterium sp. PhB142]TCL99941.1 putative ABC transport system ATP-binding protein [Curtobacterium sp. PhB134]TCU44673.1 putative ABC transport system ATP-binding protein [Curtobacterium sp. PhB146]TDW48248.1 putative ABC transport system ATP-binding protein [Curtobacterium sp. PhB42]TDW53911.1 putative ABC transport system ATP-binding protein [Cur
MSGTGPVLALREVTKTYGDVGALRGVTLDVAAGELVAVVGPSGSGKSTMLNIVGTLDRPTQGSVSIAGNDVATMSDNALSALRAEHVGFVFQQFHLQAGATAAENVADGLLYSATGRRERRRRAHEALERVGLGHRTDHRPTQLSGGEKQRVAIARAIVGNPTILLADEPTGALDSASGAAIVTLLRALNATGTTVLVITHDLGLAASLPRQVRMRDGLVEHDSAVGPAGDIAAAIGGGR